MTALDKETIHSFIHIQLLASLVKTQQHT